MEIPARMRRPCFVGEDDGLASIAEFSGNTNNNGYFVNHQNQPNMMRRKNSLRNISSLTTSTSSRASSSSSYNAPATIISSPRSARLFDPTRFEEVHSPHFLEACSLCRKPLGGNRDIFMYRGDTPFCSEECRQEQIEMDEAKEKNWNLKALRSKKDANRSSSSSSPSKAQNYPFRTGTVAAA